MTSTPPPPGWYADPAGGGGSRWWDGEQWADSTQPAPPLPQPLPQPPAEPPAPSYDPGRIQRQVQERAKVAPVAGGGGTLLTEPVLVVNQKMKLIELTNEYAVFDQHGTQIGAVVEVGQSGVRKAVRLLTSWDQFLTHRLEVRGRDGAPMLLLTRPGKVFKSTVVVSRSDGAEIGRIVQRNVVGKIRFGFEAGGTQVGGIHAENWRAWNFTIADAAGGEIGRITKTWEGLAKTMFTTADNYVVQIHRPLDEPLRSLVVASALTVDTALKQDKRGFN